MKRISHTAKARDKVLHIETDLGILNIRVGLRDDQSRRVESFAFQPDEGVDLDVTGPRNVRFIGKREED